MPSESDIHKEINRVRGTRDNRKSEEQERKDEQFQKEHPVVGKVLTGFRDVAVWLGGEVVSSIVDPIVGAGHIIGSLGSYILNDMSPYAAGEGKNLNLGTDYDFVDGGGSSDFLKMVEANTLKGVYGAPYQFLPTVDPRVDRKSKGEAVNYDPTTFTEGIGAEYGTKIISHWPLLMFTPCRQKFMDKATNEERKTALKDLITENGNPDYDSTFQGKYYTTENAYDEYFNCVNELIGALSYFIGFGGALNPFDKDDIPSDWENETTTAFKKYYAASKSVVFYADGSSLTTVEDSFSNTTTDSILSTELNSSGTKQAHELQFLLGNDAAKQQMEKKRDELATSAFSSLNDVGDITGTMLEDLTKTGINTILSGGKVILPKIWEDSGWQRSYNFTIKLRSPDHDKYSIFLNILVPYLHLLALVLPQSMKDNQDPNAYQTPFIVRVFSRGQFNIDMGMITDMSVTRGGECQWTDDGLPTAIDINITVEDLYSSLFMTNYYSTKIVSAAESVSQNLAVASNVGMMDYLANLAGLNLAQEELDRQKRMFFYLQDKSRARIASSVQTNLEQWFDHVRQAIYRAFGSTR